jgi:hypothetical protein
MNKKCAEHTVYSYGKVQLVISTSRRSGTVATPSWGADAVPMGVPGCMKTDKVSSRIFGICKLTHTCLANNNGSELNEFLDDWSRCRCRPV